MITETYGNLLDADVDALVNTVNTAGVMGKGIALQFKRRFPEMFTAYARDAAAGDIVLGRVHVWPTGQLTGPRYVINFPTKGHWRARSRLHDVERGLEDLARVVRDLGIVSLAIPPLGCGNGGLNWDDVEPLIRASFSNVPNVNAVLYPPGRTPPASEMAVGTRLPRMTPARAALLRLLVLYADRTLDTSLIEIQKLLYFLQLSGEPLRLAYVKGLYGPYADNLRHTLSEMEGHYLVGFGDGSAKVADAEPIRVLPGVADKAEAMLSEHPETVARIDRVLDLAAGFESAYGMELLATVHWIAHEDALASTDSDRAATLVREWSPRKGRMFTAPHVHAAWEALRGRGWLARPI
jgi:O-acetyl-ADP-ribose deacetylase (regulator of RNase III)